METSKQESSDSLINTFSDGWEMGWNAALDMAAANIEHDFVKAFGKDTLASIAIYLRGLKHESI